MRLELSQFGLDSESEPTGLLARGTFEGPLLFAVYARLVRNKP
jgi:hypothetical protein